MKKLISLAFICAGAAIFLRWLYDLMAPGFRGERPLGASVGWVAAILTTIALTGLGGRIKHPWLKSAVFGLGLVGMNLLSQASRDWMQGRPIQITLMLWALPFAWVIIVLVGRFIQWGDDVAEQNRSALHSDRHPDPKP